MEKWKNVLTSRKFWAALAAAGMLVVREFAPDFPVDDETIIGLLSVAIAYILGVALEDGLSRRLPSG